MAKLNAVQEELFAWYDKIHEAHDAMPEEERQELAAWERPHLGRCGYDGTLLHPRTMIGRLIFSERPYPCNTCRRGKELGLGELAELVELGLL